jgi:transcriptional regulator with XRE-family HTH domain
MAAVATFGQNVQAAMARAGMATQAELAKAMKAPPGQVSGWIDASNVELKTLFRFAKALNCSIESLIDGMDAEYDAQRTAAGYLTQLQSLTPRLSPDNQRLLVNLARGLASLPPLPEPPPSSRSVPPEPAEAASR